MTLDEITLPDDLEWSDEITWTPITQNRQYGVNGSLFIQESQFQSGRPITLIGQNDMAWIKRSVIDALMLKRNNIGKEMTLTINNEIYNVMFRQDETPIDVKAILIGSFFPSDSYYQINAIRLMEIN